MRTEPSSPVPVLVRKVLFAAAATAGFALFGIAGASAANADEGLLADVLNSETQSTTAVLTEASTPITNDVGAATAELAPVTNELAAVTEQATPVVEKAAAPVGTASKSLAQSAQPVTAAAHEVAGAVASVADPVLEYAEPVTAPALETAADVVEPVIETGAAAVQPVIAPVVEAAAPVVDPVVEAAEPVAAPVVDDDADVDASSVPVAAAEVTAIPLENDPAEGVSAGDAATASDNPQGNEREPAPALPELQPTLAQFLAKMANTPSAVKDQDAHRAAGEAHRGQQAVVPPAVLASVGGSGTAGAGGSASAGQGAAEVPFSNLLPPLANLGTADGSAWSLPASRSSDPGSSPD
ncbi:MAG TPA: hypothetical protein VHH13_10910 [Arthrobacter sp.]|nr:hypothetical protein [Arthrobacter sp.]